LPKALQAALKAATKTKSLALPDWYVREIPDAFAPLSALESLSVSGPSVSALPPSMFALVGLKKLYLTAMPNLAALPEQLGQLSRLELLNVSRTGIAALPASLNRLARLTQLVASGSKLASLPSSAVGLPLEEVNLDSCFQLDLGQLWPVLAGLPKLKRVSFQKSRLRAWPKTIARPPSLTRLDLRYAELSSADLARVRGALPGVDVVVAE
jgi:Leucine-rich repeat (LRR) protein